MLNTLVDDIKPSPTLKFIRKIIGEIPKDKEMSFATIIKLVVKFPILFYELKRFRSHVKREIFGDAFWSDERQKSSLKSKLDLKFPKDYESNFATEGRAIRETARALLSDLTSATLDKTFVLSEVNILTPLASITPEACEHLKKLLGFVTTRHLILESELPFPKENNEFLNIALSDGD